MKTIADALCKLLVVLLVLAGLFWYAEYKAAARVREVEARIKAFEERWQKRIDALEQRWKDRVDKLENLFHRKGGDNEGVRERLPGNPPVPVLQAAGRYATGPSRDDLHAPGQRRPVRVVLRPVPGASLVYARQHRS